MSTRYLKQGFAASDLLVLKETPRTRIVFDPGVHRGGVRGCIVRQTVGADGKWISVNEVNFNALPADCGVSIELDTAATKLLYDRLTILYEIGRQGVDFGEQTYLVAKEGEAIVFDDTTKAQAIRDLLESGYTDDFWAALVDEKPDLATELAAARIQSERERSIREFEVSITAHPGDESYWQHFFEAHPWMLQSAFSAPVFMLCGESYVGGKTSRGRQGAGGVVTDFLFADDSTKSFAVVEIKTPDAGLTGSLYRGTKESELDNETYSIHADLSGAIVQVRNQISVAIEHFQSILGPDYDAEKLNCVHPKGVLVIGTAEGLTARRRESLNYFRHGLHGLTVITFDELLKRLQLLFV